MGEWKAPLSLRVSPEVREELEDMADAEQRTLGNLGNVLLTWACEQLKQAGSVEQLLHKKVPTPRSPQGNYRRGGKSDVQA